MEVSLPQIMLQKLLDLLKLESLKFCLKIHVHVISHIRYQVNIDYHNQHESAALFGLFYATSLVLLSVESYPNYRKLTQRGVQGYLSSLQRRVTALRFLVSAFRSAVVPVTKRAAAIVGFVACTAMGLWWLR